MRRKITYLFLLIGFAYACAQNFGERNYGERNYPVQQEFRSQQIMSSGSNYGSTVYKPFDNSTPSEQSEVGASYSPNKAPGGPRRDKITGPDTPPANEYPVGEPWILLLFAAAFAGVVAIRKTKKS